MGWNWNFIAIKKAITLITILKKEAEKEVDKLKYFLVRRFVVAIQNAPIKTKSTPKIETWLFPKGSAKIITPRKPKKIVTILIKFIFSLRNKWDIIKSIKGEVNKTGYTTERGSLKTPNNTNKKPSVCNKPLISWNT